TLRMSKRIDGHANRREVLPDPQRPATRTCLRPQPGASDPAQSRRVPIHPRHPRNHVPRRTLDHAPVRRIRHRRRNQRAIPLPALARPDGTLRRVRPATLMGFDCDHPTSKGEVGKCGVAISSLADMETLFRGIPLGDVTVSMTINSPASIIWAMYLDAPRR